MIWGISDQRILEDKESESLLWFLARIVAAGLELDSTLEFVGAKDV